MLKFILVAAILALVGTFIFTPSPSHQQLQHAHDVIYSHTH